MPKIDYHLKDGTKISGVTTIIGSNVGWAKNQLMYWAWKQGIEGKDYKEISDKEMSAGTIAHDMIDSELKEKEFKMPEVEKEVIEKAEAAYLNWLEWKDRMKFEIEYSELSLVSEEYRYGGTIDFIPKINNKLSIFDFKTGSGIYEDHLLQVAAYQKLAQENGIETTGGIHILNLGKEDASFKHFYWQALPEAWEAFLCALKLHQIHKNLKRII
jgi:hypothetical protein